MNPKKIIQLWIAAFNRADATALANLYAEDAINHQVMFEPVCGRNAIRKMFEDEFAKSEMTCIPEHIHQSGDWVILEWRDPLGLRGCGFFQIVNGKIQLQRGYWDRLSFLKQHGLPLPKN